MNLREHEIGCPDQPSPVETGFSFNKKPGGTISGSVSDVVLVIVLALNAMHVRDSGVQNYLSALGPRGSNSQNE